MANGDVKLASQRGNMMLTTAIAVLAGSIITLTTAKNAINSANEATGTVVGNHLQVVVDGLNAYISSNSSGLNAGSVAGVANAYAPTVDELKALGFIGSWIISTPAYGGSYENAVTKKDAACSSNCSFYGTSRLKLPFVTTDKGGQVDIRLLQSAANASKTSQIGYSLPGSSSTITGPGWVLSNPDPSLKPGILMATTNVVAKTGHACPAYDVGKGIDCTSDTQLINLTGTNSTAIGIGAGAANTSGPANLFAGYRAGFSNTTGGSNVFSGAYAGYSNLTGGWNTFSGAAAGQNNLGGSNNSFFGGMAGKSTTTGNSNTFVGTGAGKSNTTGWGNSYLGFLAGQTADKGYGNVAIGYSALGDGGSLGSKNVYIGWYAGSNSTNSDSGGGENVGIGAFALQNNTSGYWNYAIGTNAMASNTTGAWNLAIGQGALSSSISADSNVAMGHAALSNLVSGRHNTAVGGDALSWAKGSVSNSTAVGHGALRGTAGANNTAVGAQAGASTWWAPPAIPGSNNVLMGYQTAVNLGGGSWNTLLGTQAGSNLGSGNYNVGVGGLAGGSIVAGTYNVYLGYGAAGSGDFTNAVAIGYNAVATANNSVRVGNASMTQIGGQVAWSNLSDRRVKEDIRDSGRGLDFVKKLRPVDYTLISNNKAETGFIAQEVEEVDGAFPGVNKPANDADFYSLTYTDFIPALVKSIQELSDKVDGLDQHDCKASDLPLTLWLAICGGLILFGWNVSLQRAVNKLKKAA